MCDFKFEVANCNLKISQFKFAFIENLKVTNCDLKILKYQFGTSSHGTNRGAQSYEYMDIAKVVPLIHAIRGQRIMLDEDLARLYGVPTKRLNEQVDRNLSRFPDDFMFRLTAEESQILRSQIATSSLWGGRRYWPRAFTREGIGMLSSVLSSSRGACKREKSSACLDRDRCPR